MNRYNGHNNCEGVNPSCLGLAKYKLEWVMSWRASIQNKKYCEVCYEAAMESMLNEHTPVTIIRHSPYEQ